MFLSALYINPRPSVVCAPRPSPSPEPLPTNTLTREAATQGSLHAEYRSRSPSFSSIADGKRCATQPLEETVNVAEALRLKQRLKARQALESAAHMESPELVPSSSSSSCASSPASSPPPTPRLLPVDLPETTQDAYLGVPDVGHSRGRYLKRSDRGEIGEGHVRAGSPLPGSPKRRHRPSQSQSSIWHRSLSRHSSRSSMASPAAVPLPTGTATSTTMDVVLRLPPLPRFDPYRRARAESLSSVAEVARHGSAGALCAVVPRRRCKSESTPSARSRL
ncbi:hypothetical protein C8Q77DRAFT_72790 [Trametes polyzona]|nr:hypothetical protein C8Q77DRAFT_72790 [Trametes polyzona]